MRIKTAARIGSASFVCLIAALTIGVSPASAVSRVSGDFYTYSMSTDIEGLNVTGTVTYSFEGTDTLSLGDQSYDVNVMKVSGSVSGAVDFLSFSASAELGGHAYETKDGMAIVKDDALIWINVSIGTGSFQLVNRTMTESISTYSPPIMSDFSPSTTGPGDSWTETIEVTTTTMSWVDGSMQGSPSTDTEQIVVGYAAASSTESVETPAGTFKTLKITATESNGDSVVYWWSSEVGNFVKQQEFNEGNSQPSISMVLTDYNHRGSTSAILFIGIGLGVALFAVIVLVIVLMMRRRPGQPIPYQPGMPAPQPYAPSPQGPPPPPGSEPFLRAARDFARRTG